MRISIVTVTRNSRSVIEDCLNSVAKQSYPDVEHIVIDGASDDGTLDLIQSKKARLSIIVSEPDSGIYDAMNKGIGYATGEVVGFLNSDDVFESDQVIERVASLFAQDESLDACYANLVYVQRSNIDKVVRFWKSKAFVPGNFSRGWCPPHPTFYVRRRLFDNFGRFDLGFQIAADVELMMRFLEVDRVECLFVDELWVRMRIGGTTNNTLTNILRQNREVLKALRGHGIRANSIIFYWRKLISRSLQFLLRPND